MGSYSLGDAVALLEEMSRASGMSRSAVLRAAITKLYHEWCERNKNELWLLQIIKQYDVDVNRRELKDRCKHEKTLVTVLEKSEEPVVIEG